MIAITDFAERTAGDAGSAYAVSTEPFEAWVKDRILKISGIDQATEPLGPATECIFDWPRQHV